MLGKIVPEGTTLNTLEDPNLINQVDVVSCKEVLKYGSGLKRVVLVDCGVKHNIIRCFVNRGVEVIRVPWNYDFSTIEYDGLFISNGPGDPNHCVEAVINIQKAIEKRNLFLVFAWVINSCQKLLEHQFLNLNTGTEVIISL
jgi:carbamoyl-phosphate synthase small subunit